MAIQDSFNLSNAINSQSYAYKCWYNYNYGNNTMGISAKDMGEITQTWNNELKNWQAVAMDDENAYEISDDDFSMSKKNGAEQAKNKTGYDGGKGGIVANTTVDAVLSSAGAIAAASSQGLIRGAVGSAFNTVGGLVKSGSAKVFGEKAVKEGTKKAAKEGTKKAAKKDNNASAYAAAILAIATAAKYRISKPNKEQKKACDALQDEMVNANNSLCAAQDEMSAAGEEVQALVDEAQITNEDANGEIEENKSEYDMYKASYDALMKKVESGETLTEDEKELLQELVPLMQELGEDIGDIQDDTKDVTGDIYDEIGDYQDVYDNSAETIAEVQGLTDYAESFDSATQTMCYIESGAQGLNAYSGYSAGAKLCAGGWWNWALGLSSIAAGASSTASSLEQFQWAGDVGTEINARKGVQDFNSLTNDIYDESIDVYDGNMSIVEDLELEIPKDLEDMQKFSEEAAEGAPLAANTTGGNGANDGVGGVQPEDKKDKEDNE